jgi:hypothetical protein
MKKIILIVALFLSTTFQTLLCQAPSYVPSNGLMGWWPFNGNANDQSGNNLNGTVTGATLTSDRNGNQNSAYSFTTNQDITIPNTSNLNSYPLTVSLWYNVATLASTGESSNIFSKYVSSSWNGFHIFLFDARNINSGNTQYNDGYSVVPWYLRDTSNRVLGYYGETPFLQPNIQTNTWYHYVFTLDSSGGKIYVNNQLVDSHPWTGTPGASTNNFLWKIGGLYDTWFKGKIDDVGVWNRVLTPTEIQQLYTGCTTVAPSGTATQSFCEVGTVANLTATGTAIKWYAAATGGTALASTTALVNGTTYYASQTINGCESTSRFAVKVILNLTTLTASSTTICKGESVQITATNNLDSSFNWSTGQSEFINTVELAGQFSHISRSNYENTFNITPGDRYRLDISGNVSYGGGAGNQRDVAFYTATGSDGTIEGTALTSVCNSGTYTSGIYTSLFCDTPGLRPTPNVYDPVNHLYKYPFTAQSTRLTVGFWDTPLGDNAANTINFKLYRVLNNSSSITVTPTQTTTYWVDVTTNGVTCRKSITITVNNTPTPTGATTQTFCSSNTVANLVATGTAIKWYASATGGSALASTAVLVNGTTYYGSQTLNGCESNTRLAVVATVLPNPSAPTGATQQTVCEATTIANLTATGTAIKWYATAIGGTALANTTNLSGTNYYASQTVNGCESVSRLVVNVIINAATLSAANTTICAGQSTSLTTTLNLQSLNSCISTSNTNFIAFTPITTTGNYVNIIKNNNNYFLRSDSNVLFSNNLLGPYTSLNYNTQIGIDLAGELLGVDNLNRLHVATGHDGLFKYNGTNWSSGGLTGFGTGGQYFTKLSNGRIVIAKSGYLRGIYYSDNNGDTWTKATNVDVDWNNITIASNGDLYASSGIGGADNKGIVKSTNNGSSWTYLNSTLGITTSTGVYKDCNNSLYIIGDNKIFKSRDIGVNWAQIANLPSFYNSFPSYGEFVVTSNGDFYYLGDGKLFYSSNHGNNWTEITSISGELKKIKEIDGNIVVCSTQGVFAKSLISPTYLWSTGATTDTINVSPTQTTTYWVDVTTNGVTCRKSIAITVNPKPEVPTQTLTVCNGVPFTFSPVNATPTAATVVPQGTTYTWSVASNPNVTGEANSSVSGISSISQTLINTTTTPQTVVYTVTPTSGAGCQGSPFTLTITLAALIPAPSAEIIQTFCTGAAISDLKATGTSGATIKWYSAYTGGTSISPNVSLVNGSIYYASQTINGCESLLRTGIIVGLTSPIITPSATTVCAGTNVTLASSTPIVLGVNNSILATILQNGLVGYWPFNSNANDMSGNGINGTVNGAVVTNDRYGNPNSAYQFDGIENTINQANPFFGGNQVSSFSFGALFNVSSTSNSPNIWGKTKFWGEVNLIIHNDNSIEFVWANSVTGNKYSSVRSTPNSIKLNTWNNVVVVFENSILKIYINGILVESNMKWTAQGGTILSTTRVEQYCNFAQDAGSNRFGIRNTGGFWGNYFKGTIDDVAIWNRALSPLEIQGLYAMTNTDYTWSTGAKTATISVSPLQTTTYWVDVTTYGVTCRKEVTVTIVNPPPTGNASQAFLPGDTIANLNVTGTNIKWYTSATGGSALPSNTPLVNGVVYYASQTINSCESLSRFGVTVTIFSLPFDNFSITTKSETCSGKNNGEITINATQVHPYIAKVNGTSYSFTNNSLSLPNLTPGIYSVCISVDGKIFQQCFTISIAKGGTLTGKSTFSSNKALVEITEGTAPFEVLVNGIPQFETNDTNFSVDVRQGDLLVVKTSVACEGIYSQNILEGLDQVIAHPNPTSGIFEITIPTSKENVEVELYTINAQLISKKNYKVNNHRVQLSLENQSEGVYIAKVNLDIPVSLTIIKKL